ncbi:MAG: hypothetical protein M2R45_04107 [Verrucomicrobia subdivision 3 bacterium]|nr:hypothetical protein [Limisphaerales bacterium]MCS1417092.1 hypothetical protein [Limisphaerales bacterium]
MLSRCSNGFGSIALLALMQGAKARAVGANRTSRVANPLAAKSPHYQPKAKQVIMLYMDGGPAQMDTFDPKPRLTVEHGKPFGMKMEPTQFNNNGNTFGSHWKFRKYGQSGVEISDLFPHVAKQADELCVIRSMVSEFSEHTNGNYFLHTGLGLSGRPSAGAWVTYGLGTENENLPGFIVLNGGLTPPGGLDNFSSGFLPATFQGSMFRHSDPPVANINPQEKSAKLQQNKLSLLQALDQSSLNELGRAGAVESAISNYELAFRMQSDVPELMALDQESDQMRRMYGLESNYKPTQVFGTECLLARRLVERGVRFVELTCPNVGADRWDQHSDLLGGHTNNARAVDQPIGALLADLRGRGLLDETLVIWCGEFGRTPFSQGVDGRDHNPFGFSIWLAGGGIKGGMAYGATDEYGYKTVENRVEIYDLHATMLHLLGIDHTRLTVRFSGRDMRLTDVHGQVVQGILA